MNSKLLSCGTLQIPKALRRDHEMLRAGLMRATAQQGRIGKEATHLAQLCVAHFADEEKNVNRAIGLLCELTADRARRVRSDLTRVAPLIAQWSAQHLAQRGLDQPINAAIGELLQEARKAEHKEIAELLDNLKDHELLEDQVMYPTLLLFDRSVFESLRN